MKPALLALIAFTIVSTHLPSEMPPELTHRRPGTETHRSETRVAVAANRWQTRHGLPRREIVCNAPWKTLPSRFAGLLGSAAMALTS